MYANDLFRKRAWNALKSIFPIALVVSLCATLPSLLGEVAVTRYGGELMEALEYISAHQSMPAEQMMQLLEQAFTPALSLALIVQFVLTLAFSFLRLGRTHFLLKLLRGEEVAVSDLLSRAGILFKALGQQLYISLLIFLWGLPGVALTIAGAVIFVIQPTVSTLNLMVSLYLAGLALSAVLGIRASLHYTMAPTILADHPETGIRASVKASLDIMRRRKLLYFSLLISFFGWILLEAFAELMITSVSTLMGMTLGMALRLALNLYVDTAVVAFYEAYRANGVPPTDLPEQPEELNP